MPVVIPGLINGDVEVLTRNSKRTRADGPCKSRYARTKRGLGSFNDKLQTNGERSMQVIMQGLNGDVVVLTRNSKRTAHANRVM